MNQTKKYKSVDLPYSTYETMNFPEDAKKKIFEITEEAVKEGRFDCSQDIYIDRKNLEYRAYWIYKTKYPMIKPMKGFGIEERFFPFKKTNFEFDLDGLEVEKELDFTAVGDLMCTKGLEESKDLLYEYVADDIFDADYRFANLESTLTKGELIPLEISMNKTPSISATLEQYKTMISHKGKFYDVVQLSNNHILDRGEEGVETTLSQLKQDRIDQIGIFETEKDANNSKIVEVNGIKIAWVSYTFSVNGKPIPEDKPWIVKMAPYSVEKDPDITSIVEEIKVSKKVADLVFLSIHWGWEFEFFPHPDQLKSAESFVEAGVDAIIGHHPHVIQPVEILHPSYDKSKNVPVIYSLGNLTSVLSNPSTVLSLIARFKIVKGYNKKKGIEQVKISSGNFTPVVVVLEDKPLKDILRVIKLKDLIKNSHDEEMAKYVENISYYAELIFGDDWKR